MSSSFMQELTRAQIKELEKLETEYRNSGEENQAKIVAAHIQQIRHEYLPWQSSASPEQASKVKSSTPVWSVPVKRTPDKIFAPVRGRVSYESPGRKFQVGQRVQLQVNQFGIRAGVQGNVTDVAAKGRKVAVEFASGRNIFVSVSVIKVVDSKPSSTPARKPKNKSGQRPKIQKR